VAPRYDTSPVTSLMCRHQMVRPLLRSKTSSVYRTTALCIALAAMLGSAACTGLTGQAVPKGGGGTQTEPPPAQPPATPPPTQAATPSSQLSASTTQVSFGNVTVGNSTSQIVSLTDVGNADITISGISASGTGYGASGGSSVTLNPTQSVSVYVSFDPASPGSVTGALSISSNASNPMLNVGLTGTGVAAAVQHSVGLTWVPSASPVIGYYVYRGSSVNSLAKLNTSVDASASYTDQSVAGGQTYVYAVTSVDSSNVESGFSNQVSVTIPNN
jgi:hypothetical protein